MSLLERLLRYRWSLSLLLVVVLPFTLRGAINAWHSNSNEIADWLPDDFEATRQLQRFVSLFGSDELLMISWDGCTLDDSRIATFRERLLAPVATETGEVVYYREVFTGPAILESFRSPPLSMSEKDALDRMTGWIVSADGHTTCLVALVSEAGAFDRHAAVTHVFATADGIAGLSADKIHVAGPTIESVAVDQASQSNLLELNLASFAICLLIMVLSLRSLRAAMLVFLLALFNEQLSMALVYYTGSHFDSILLLAANLTFVLTVSVGMHLVNYYRDAMSHGAVDDAVMRACRAAWKPTLLATTTTALGLISLTVSQIKPISRFGAYSAASILIGVFVALVYTALHFKIWPLRRWSRDAKRASRSQDFTVEHGRIRRLSAVKWPVLLVAVSIVIFGGLGALRLQTSVGLSELLSPGSRVLKDYRWLETRIGPLIPVEVLIEMPSGDAREMLRQFRTIDAVHRSLQEHNMENVVISSATFAPEPPPLGGGFRQVAQAAVFRRALVNRQEQLRDLGYLVVDSDTNYWRITVRTESAGESDYGVLLRNLRNTVTAVTGRKDMVTPGRVVVCGGVPLVYQAQQQLLEDLIYSFLLAFGLVACALMLLFRSVTCGAICMIPNVLPSAAVFGIMGWRGSPVEIGAILTASAALGVAVDDSLHFITWFRRAISDGGSIQDAVAFAYRRCSAAMVQTTFICGFGLAVFGFSPFAPIAKFGWCMLALLMIALLGDLVVLPCILLSPLGRAFLPKNRGKTADGGTSSEANT